MMWYVYFLQLSNDDIYVGRAVYLKYLSTMFFPPRSLALKYFRRLIIGLIIIAIVAHSMPITHTHHGHGHHHGDIAESSIDTGLPDKQNETDDRSTHQHIGLNEHNPGHLSVAFSGFNLNARSEQWRFVKAQPPRQDFLYALERPPRA